MSIPEVEYAEKICHARYNKVLRNTEIRLGIAQVSSLPVNVALNSNALYSEAHEVCQNFAKGHERLQTSARVHEHWCTSINAQEIVAHEEHSKVSLAQARAGAR